MLNGWLQTTLKQKSSKGPEFPTPDKARRSCLGLFIGLYHLIFNWPISLARLDKVLLLPASSQGHSDWRTLQNDEVGHANYSTSSQRSITYNNNKMQIESGERTFICRVPGPILGDRVGSLCIRMKYSHHSLMWRRSQLRWFWDLIKGLPARLSLETLWTCPTGRRPLAQTQNLLNGLHVSPNLWESCWNLFWEPDKWLKAEKWADGNI